MTICGIIQNVWRKKSNRRCRFFWREFGFHEIQQLLNIPHFYRLCARETNFWIRNTGDRGTYFSPLPIWSVDEISVQPKSHRVFLRNPLKDPSRNLWKRLHGILLALPKQPYPTSAFFPKNLCLRNSTGLHFLRFSQTNEPTLTTLIAVNPFEHVSVCLQHQLKVNLWLRSRFPPCISYGKNRSINNLIPGK